MCPNSRPKARRCWLWTWPWAALLAACGETTIAIDSGDRLDLESGLVLHLRLDEADTGALASDSSGRGHDGSPSASAPTPNPSVPPVGFENPRSLAFNGSDQLLDLGNPPDLDFPGVATLAAWVRPVDTNGYRNIIAHGFRWEPSRELSLRVHDSNYEFTAWNGVDHQAAAAMTPGDADSWHHVAGVYDGQSYRLYRDGALIDESTDTFVPTTVDAPWAVGGRSTADPVDGRYFSGSIDEVRIYQRALNDDEVRALARL